jgi:hypothetical protein
MVGPRSQGVAIESVRVAMLSAPEVLYSLEAPADGRIFVLYADGRIVQSDSATGKLL